MCLFLFNETRGSRDIPRFLNIPFTKNKEMKDLGKEKSEDSTEECSCSSNFSGNENDHIYPHYAMNENDHIFSHYAINLGYGLVKPKSKRW